MSDETHDSAKIKAEWNALREALALTPVEIVRCVTLYFHNVEPQVQFEAASGESWDDKGLYRKEKLNDYHLGLGTWFSRFDPERQAAWVDAAIKWYAESVGRAVTIVNVRENR